MKFTRWHAFLSASLPIGVGLVAGGVITFAVLPKLPVFFYAHEAMGFTLLIPAIWARVHRRKRFAQLEQAALDLGGDGDRMVFTASALKEVAILAPGFAEAIREAGVG